VVTVDRLIGRRVGRCPCSKPCRISPRAGIAPPSTRSRQHSPREQQLCEFWRDWELRLLRPELIVTVGGLAARRLLGLERLGACVGARFELDGACVVPLPHPSGASGWLNDPGNRAKLEEALGLVREQLARLY
jgi:uracil-DNA glycosylase